MNGLKKTGISCKNSCSENELMINNAYIEEDLFNCENMNLNREKILNLNSEESDLSDDSDDIK